VEGHGREELFDDVDLSRTAGWFTSVYPVLLSLTPGAGAADSLLATKEQLRAIPNRGIGYGLLRHLGDDQIAARLSAMPAADILFNYLGQFDTVLESDSPLTLASESPGPTESPDRLRTHPIEVNAQVDGGCLLIDWTFGSELYRPETIQQLGDR